MCSLICQHIAQLDTVSLPVPNNNNNIFISLCVGGLGQFHVSENSLITFTSRLDALDARKMYYNQ